MTAVLTFIASHWAYWLFGVVACLGFALYRNISKMGSTVKTMGTLMAEVSDVASDKGMDFNQKTALAMSRMVEEGKKTAEEKARTWVYTIISVILINGFGLLLAISVVCGLIDYFKA